MKSLIDLFKAARRAAVPIVAVETADQQGTLRTLLAAVNGNTPMVRWDAIRGLTPANQLGVGVINDLIGADEPTMFTNPSEMLARAVNLPERAIICMMNAHRFLGNEFVAQGIANLRDIYKANGATMILLAPDIQLPSELKHDIMILSEPLPDAPALEKIAKSICDDAKVSDLPKDFTKIVDTLVGLSGYEAEQTLSTCIYKDPEDKKVKIDRPSLWDRKCKAIENTKGLAIARAKELFADLGGCENIKTFLRMLFKGKKPKRAVVWLDEIEKAFAGSSTDSSGTTQDQLGAILTEMQEKGIDGLIFVGPPGAAKSAIAKAAGNEAGIPTIAFDLGAMKGSLVGQSGAQTRAALKVIDAVSQGQALFIATCNSLANLPPELKRRFTLGIWYFDLPTAEERKLIWDIYFKKYELPKQKLPNDEGWTGAEIRKCADIAWNLGISLIDASAYIVPVAKSNPDVVESLRRQASGKFIDAGKSGVYNMPATTIPAGTRRAINNAN